MRSRALVVVAIVALAACGSDARDASITADATVDASAPADPQSTDPVAALAERPITELLPTLPDVTGRATVLWFWAPG